MKHCVSVVLRPGRETIESDPMPRGDAEAIVRRLAAAWHSAMFSDNLLEVIPGFVVRAVDVSAIYVCDEADEA